MAIVRWKPFEEVNRLFENLSLIQRQGFELAADVYEKNGNVIIEMNTAGMDPEDINITVEDDFVRISGTREEEEVKEERDYFVKEIRRGSFERIIDLPTEVSPEETKAEFKNGILIIALPKLSKKGAKKVKVEKKKKEKEKEPVIKKKKTTKKAKPTKKTTAKKKKK